MRQPIITFQSADGREITFTSRIHAAGHAPARALVEIYHDPVDPTRACIAPESLTDITPPLGLAEKYVIGNIWFLALVVTVHLRAGAVRRVTGAPATARSTRLRRRRT